MLNNTRARTWLSDFVASGVCVFMCVYIHTFAAILVLLI